MPPKAKYSREEIIAAALELTREKGIDAVVARELGKKLGTSSSPIFTAFHNMEEVRNEVRKAAMRKFEECVSDGGNDAPTFKHVGMKMIQFAIEEPKLFQLLYMREHKESQKFEDLIGELGDTADVCLEMIQKEYDLSRYEAEVLFQQTWMHTFAICVLMAGKVCYFTEKEIVEILGRVVKGTLMLIKSGRLDSGRGYPENKG